MIKAFVVVFGLIATVAALDCKVAGDGYYCNSDITTYTWCAGGSSYAMKCGAGTACQCAGGSCGSSAPCTTYNAPVPSTTGAKKASTTGAKAPSTTGAATTFCTSAKDGYYCNSNSSTYTWCSGGSLYVMPCGAGTSCQCKGNNACAPNVTACKANAAPAPATTGAPAAPPATFCTGLADGYYCNSNTSTFTQCAGGSTYVQPCAAGTSCQCTGACPANTAACQTNAAPAPSTTGAPAAPPATFCTGLADGYYCNSNTSTFTQCAGGSTYVQPCGAGTSCQCTGACPANTAACTTNPTPAPATTGAAAPAVQCEQGNSTAATTFCQSKLNSAPFPDGYQYFCDAQSAGVYQCVTDAYCPSKASPRSSYTSCPKGTVCAGSDPARCVVKGN